MREIVVLLVGFFLICAQTQGQSYGLQFASHEVIPEKRTSLHLTPKEPICLNGATSVSFDFKFVPNSLGYFGYIVRVITSDQRNIDIIYNQNAGQFRFVVGENYSFGFSIDSIQLYGKWNRGTIQFNPQKSTVELLLNNKSLSTSPFKFTSTTCCDIFFGANELELFKAIDVPAMQIKDIEVSVDQKLKYAFPLSDMQGGRTVDRISQAQAIVRNPEWIKPRHVRWKLVQTLQTSSTPSIAFDPVKEVLFLVSSDSVYQFSVQKNELQRIAFAEKRKPLKGGNQSVFDPARQQLYHFLIDQKWVSAYLPQTQNWDRALPDSLPLTAYWHANKFISASDQSLYVIGGYGWHQYKNKVQRYRFKDKVWEEVAVKGDFFMPRYLAALGTNEKTDTAFILGGYGSKTGDQALSPKYNYELLTYAVKTQTIQKRFQLPQPDTAFCFSNSLVIDEQQQSYYGLIYPIDRFNSSLQLIRGSLQKPTYEKLGESIPYSFHDIESFSDLFYCRTSQKLLAVTLFSPKDKPATIEVYTIDFPPNQLVQAATNAGVVEGDSIKWWWILPLLAVLAGGLVYRRRRISKKKDEKKDGEKIDRPLVPPTAQEAPSNPVYHRPDPLLGIEEEEPLKSTIHFFGHFEAFDKEGNEITRLFTPLLKEMFLLIVMATYRDGKGIAAEVLYETLWGDKSLKDARNNFGVNIVKLKSILERIGNSSLSKDTGKWKWEILDDSIKLDYEDFLRLMQEKPDGKSKAEIVRLYELVKRGALLRELQYEWLDEDKAAAANFVVQQFLSYTETVPVQQEPEWILRLCQRIFQFDIYNEEALALKCKALICLGKHSLAKDTYVNFAKEYHKSYGQDFETSFEKLVG